MKSNNYNVLALISLGTLFVIGGIIMIINRLVAVGVNSRTLKLSGFGGYLLILVGVIFLYVGYISISPFSKFRSFLEGGSKKKSIKRKNSKAP
jgi:hypothetical protein